MIETIATIYGTLMILGGVFGLGVWFTRWYDFEQEIKNKHR